MGKNPDAETQSMRRTDTQPADEPQVIDNSMPEDFADDEPAATPVDEASTEPPDQSPESEDPLEGDMDHPLRITFWKEHREDPRQKHVWGCYPEVRDATPPEGCKIGLRQW